METEIDRMFFAKQNRQGMTSEQMLMQMRLNKGEKRALKFAIK